MTGKAVAYIRVSTDEQAAFGGSIPMQRDRLADYCRLLQLDLVETIVDRGVSGSVPLGKRRGGARMLELLSIGQASHIVALKLDRLFRDAANALQQTREWDRGNVALHLVDMGGQAIDTSSAMGRVFLTMMAAFAEFERNVIGERTRAVLRHKRVKREAYSPTPLGFRRDGKQLVEDDSEQAVLARIRSMSNEGMSLNAIARELNEAGVPTKRGAKFHASTIRYILANRALYGKAA